MWGKLSKEKRDIVLYRRNSRHLYSCQKRTNSIEDKYLDAELKKEQYNRMLERYAKEASALQPQIEKRTNPNRGNIEPKLNYYICLKTKQIAT